MTRCMGCMSEMSEEEQICRICGYQRGTDVSEAYYLLPGTSLRRKYSVGKVLGYGGFGVTYIGWDNVLQRKVAIKEYLPSDFATRSYGILQLTVFSGEAAEQFEAGLESFLYEARRLAKFHSIPEIVDIYDCFKENGSGYIVMEFLDGATLKEILKKKRRVSVAQARAIVLSVLRGLAVVHKAGIIHRDIAPDNIFITKLGMVKILDFGAARYATTVQSKSLSVILKPGFAPEEQYRSHGVQGPWTDIYALGATFYCMITGMRPEESIQRLADDQLRPPSELGIVIDLNIENAIMNSLNVRQEYRIQDAPSFYRALQGKDEVERIIEKKDTKINWKLPIWIKCGVGIACVLVCICIRLFATGNISFSKKEIMSSDGTAALSGTQRYVPNISGMSYEEAEELLKQKNLNIIIKGMNYSDSISKNRILSQNPGGGAVADMDETINVIMSGGCEEVMMPDLVGMTREEAETLIKGQNLIISAGGISETYSDVVEKGRIISQNIEAEERIAVQTEISFSVSLGNLSEETVLLTVPDLSGATRKKAIQQLKQLKKEYGFTYSIGEVKNEYSKKVKKGRIIRQFPEAGSKVRTNEPIYLVISKGPEMVQVPELVYASREEAEKKLKKAGLKAQISSQYSSMVSEGLVISQDRASGSKVVKGSQIAIIVSLGKEPVQQDSNRNQPQTGTGSIQTPPGGSTAGGQSQTGGSQVQSGGSTGGAQTKTGDNTDSIQTQPDGDTGGSRIQSGTSETSGQTQSGGDIGGRQTQSGSERISAPNENQTSNDTGGERVLMPDGGSFEVE